MKQPYVPQTSLETWLIGVVFLAAQTPNMFSLMERIGDRAFDRLGNTVKRGMAAHNWQEWS